MFNLLLLVNFASLVAFAIGLINPKLVLRGDNRTRRKSSEVYLSVFVLSFIGMLVFVPKHEPLVVVAPPPGTIAEAVPTLPPETKLSPTPTPVKATPIPTPEFVAFDPSVCKTDAYFPVNGASTALYSTCQYIKIGSFTPDVVARVTPKNGENDKFVLELEAESGFERFGVDDFNPITEQTKDVCIVYKDKSVSCYKFLKEPI
ncbi:hypothetical protein [Halotia branconii]|uniref:Uncharacterized protein n=1 Tax=Halotia branconii CENA392 TaxID=1539056 RepID=A0AAJ6PBE5_9CYAN|nr:hypothetical protein [Halotia branconii]WGV27731.1 hypothetical protein QI031_09705 [Halotia branconii CENA392]